MKTQAAFLLGAWLLLANASAQSPNLVQSLRSDNQAWFFFDQPHQAQRYDLKERKWRPPVDLSLGRADEGAIKIVAAAMDFRGLYVAYLLRGSQTTLIFAFGTDGSPQGFLAGLKWRVGALHLDGNLLVALEAKTGLRGDGRAVVLKRGSGIMTPEQTLPFLIGTSIDLFRDRIFGVVDGAAPGFLVSLSYGDNGIFGLKRQQVADDYRADRTWLFPDGSKVLDSAGMIYSAKDLSSVGSLSGSVTDAAFLPNGSIIISRKAEGYQFIEFSKSYERLGSARLKVLPSAIWICGDYVLGFTPWADTEHHLIVQTVSLGFLAGARLSKPILNGLTVTAAKDVLVTWNSVAAASSYVVERRAKSGDWEEVGDSNETAFTDTSVEPGGGYEYRVVAKSGDAFSEPSDALSVSIPADPDIPPAPPAAKPDLKRPVVKIIEDNHLVTPRRTVLLHARASDNRGVAGVQFSVNGEKRFRQARKNGSWEMRVPLNQRLTSVRARAVDTSGNVSDWEQVVIFRTSLR